MNTDAPSLKLHPACALFPELTADELQALAADIKANGLHEPVRLLDNQILDGRNRYLACRIAGINPKFEGLTHEQVPDPVAYSVSKNLHRRHLSAGQRADIAAKISQLKQGQNAPHSGIPSISESAKLLNVSVDSVKVAKQVQKRASRKVKAALQSGDMTLNAAAATIGIGKAKPDEPTPKPTPDPLFDTTELSPGRFQEVLDAICARIPEDSTSSTRDRYANMLMAHASKQANWEADHRLRSVKISPYTS